MDIIGFIELIEKHGLIVVLFMLGWMYLHFQFKRVDARFEGVDKRIDGMEKDINARIDGMEKDINARIDGMEKNIDKNIKEIKDGFVEHERKCEEKHQQFIEYMKEHAGRISHMEGRLDERQQ